VGRLLVTGNDGSEEEAAAQRDDETVVSKDAALGKRPAGALPSATGTLRIFG
jgi:hypothetical protein